MPERVKTHAPLSVEEYLELEESATVRHEYVAGEIFAMVGARGRHVRISLNIASRLLGAARGGECRVYASDMKLKASEDAVYYPDVMVVCESPVEENPLFETAPCLVVEVTSTSTETVDRREKLAAYRKLPSLQAYLIVAPDRAWIERHFRDEGGVWRRADLLDTGTFPVPCPAGLELSVGEIYEDIF